MGLFDFLKKKLAPPFSETQQSITPPSKPAYKEPVSTNANGKTIGEVAFEKASVEKNGPPPLSDLLKTATPSNQGLYPHEIMMLVYAPRFKTSNNNFQNFWYWEYSVTDPQSILNSLLERDFIKMGDLKSTLEKLKLPEIKEELKQINQKVTGKKAELVERLIEFGDHTVLNQKYSERYYALTPKGEQELNENQYVPYLHKNPYMSVWDMNRRIAETHHNYRDILWGYFNEQSLTHFKNCDFGLYRNTRLDMYQFLMEENKFNTAFSMLCEILSFDLSGLQNGDCFLFNLEDSNPKLYVEIYKSNLEYFFPYKETILTVPPAVAAWFEEMQITLGLDNKNYKEAIIKKLSNIHPPRRIFTDEECADILMASIRNDTTTLTKIYKEAEKREILKLEKIKSKMK